MRRTRFAALIAVAALALAACGGPRRLVEVPPHQSEVRITSTNFSFDPAQIVARAGETLVLQIHNASRSAHNFTVADPAGTVLRSVELIPGKAVRVELPLPTAGVYPFHCAKTLHPTLGMTGRIEAR